VKIEIICIGNELLIGKIENTNAHWLAQQTTRLGANAILITVSDVFCECSIFADDNVESPLAPLIDWVMADNVGCLCEVSSFAFGG